GRRKQNAITRGIKVAASGAPLAGRDQLGCSRLTVRRIDSDRIDLIAWDAFTLMLEDQGFVVGRPVGLRVLPAECKLGDVAQVLLAGISKGGLCGWRRCMLLAVGQDDSSHGEAQCKRDSRNQSWFRQISNQHSALSIQPTQHSI